MGLKREITPWPLELGVDRVAIVGGTFDPPHRAHAGMARVAMGAMGAGAGVVFVPASASPFKVGVTATAAAHRLAMVRLAVMGEERWGVWSDEIDRSAEGEASFMVETLQRAVEVTGGKVALRLVLGADQVLRFHQWRAFREIVRLAPPLVLLRRPVGSAEALRAQLEGLGVWSGAEIEAWCAGCVDAPLDDVSSTRVREAVGEGVERARGMVADGVLEYIGEQGLYR